VKNLTTSWICGTVISRLECAGVDVVTTWVMPSVLV
jgi:hypothetical protein